MSSKTNPGPGNSIRNKGNVNSGIPTGKSSIPGMRKINYNDTISEFDEPVQQLIEDTNPFKADIRKAQGTKTSMVDPKSLK